MWATRHMRPVTPSGAGLRVVGMRAPLQKAVLECITARAPAMDVPYDEIDYDDLEDIRYISKGNFGQIYRANYHGTDVAVKQLLDIGNTRMHKYIEREMSLLMSLRHPHIVQFMGLCKHNNELFIITEFVPGGDLYDRLRDPTKISWKKRVQVALETAQAIAYLHSKEVIHRDLKSQNLLVDDSFRIKICDFGFARSLDPSEFMTMCGTDEWMAPEVILGDKYDDRADVFSFGMILAELILRRDPPPRLPGNAYAFEPDVLRQSLPSDCPEELFDICVDCTRFYPEDRPDTRVLVKRLKELLKNTPDDSGAMEMDNLTYMKFEGQEGDEEEKKKKKKKRRKRKTEDGEEGDEEEEKRKKKKKRRKRKTEEGDEEEDDERKKRSEERKKRKKKKKSEEDKEDE